MKICSIAKERGGKCLSEAYINRHTKLLWECSQRHRWEAIPHSIKRGRWCPYCAGKKKLSIEDMQYIAKERGGKCLSETYINSHTKLLWECSQGHRWEATSRDIKWGTWCPTCAGKIYSNIELMREIAENRGGKCLSEKYINSKNKLLWSCSKGHQWKAIPESIINNHWCPECSGNLKKTIENMQELAARRGGKCLSQIYINSQTKLLWECSQRHKWEAKPNKIQQGTWCPTCWQSRRKNLKNGLSKIQ